MFKTTTHTLKYSTKQKLQWLTDVEKNYLSDLNSYINMMWNGEIDKSKWMTSKNIPNLSLKHSQWKEICYHDALGRVNYALENRLNKPIITKFEVNIDNRLFDIQQIESNMFDGFMKLKLPFMMINKKKAISIRLPFKYHKHFSQYKESSDWIMKNTIKLSKRRDDYCIKIIFESKYDSVKPTKEMLIAEHNRKIKNNIDRYKRALKSYSMTNGVSLKHTYKIFHELLQKDILKFKKVLSYYFDFKQFKYRPTLV